MVLLLTAYFLLFAIIAWRRPLAALWILVAALPSYLIRFEVFGIPMTLLEGMILLLVAVTAIRKAPSPWPSPARGEGIPSLASPLTGEAPPQAGVRVCPFILPISLFLLAATISLFVAPDLRAAAGIWKAYFIEPVLFFLVFLTLVKTNRDRNSIISALGVSALAVSTLAIYQHFTGWEIPAPWFPEATRRVTSFYGYPNAVGLYLAPIIALAIGQLISHFQKLVRRISAKKNGIAGHAGMVPPYSAESMAEIRAANASQGHLTEFFHAGIPSISFWLLTLITSTLAIIFSHTEGAWIAIPAGLLISGFLLQKYRRVAGIITICTIITTLTIPLLRSYTLKQFSFRGDSGATRLSIWKESFAMLKDRPIFGAGLAGYQQAMIPYHKAKHIEIYLYPHNIFLNFWSETGLLGLIIFLWIMWLAILKNLRTNELTSFPELASMLVLLIHGLVDVPYFKNDLAILFWILLALIISSRDQQVHPYLLPHQKREV